MTIRSSKGDDVRVARITNGCGTAELASVGDADPVWCSELARSALLQVGEVHVWCAFMPGLLRHLTLFHAVMSEDERERGGRYLAARDRQRFTVARGLLRSLLGRYLDIPADKLHFAYGPYGKPLLDASLHFNVSHSGEYVTIAVGWGVPVGVDIERVDGRVDALSIAARFFRAEEHRHLEALEGKARDRAFFRMWTQKEASLKATGIGIRGLDDSTSLLGTSSGPSGQPGSDDGNSAGTLRLVEVLGVQGYCVTAAMALGSSGVRME